MRSIAVIAAIVAAIYVALVVLAWLLQDRLVYLPDPTPARPADAGLSRMAVVRTTTEDGLDLAAWHAPPAAGRPTLVYLHGNAGHLGYRAERFRVFLEAGYGVMGVGWRGYGGNPGRPSEQGLYRDARAAIAWLADEGVPPGRLVLYGESLGSGVAVQMATELPVAALVLEAPYTSLLDVGATHYPFLPVRWLGRHVFDNLGRIGGIRAPLLVIHGGQDAVVPQRLGRTLFAAAPEPKEALFPPHAGHNDLFRHGGLEAVLDFLARHVPAAGQVPRSLPAG